MGKKQHACFFGAIQKVSDRMTDLHLLFSPRAQTECDKAHSCLLLKGKQMVCIFIIHFG